MYKYDNIIVQGREGNPMIRKINNSEFRNHLKDYLAQTANNPGQILQTGNDLNVLVMSKATLAKLQYRHYINTWARNQYCTLKLDSYLTLTDGKQTKELPLDTILALSCFFRLVKELLDILAHPGAKENALTWDVSPYIKAAINGNTLTTHGTFHSVYTVITRLFHIPEFCKFEKTEDYTLFNFFTQIQEQIQTDDALLKTEGLSADQIALIRDIITKLSGWILDLLNYQVLTPDIDEKPELIFLSFGQLVDWYEENISERPTALGYDPDIEAYKLMI